MFNQYLISAKSSTKKGGNSVGQCNIGTCYRNVKDEKKAPKVRSLWDNVASDTVMKGRTTQRDNLTLVVRAYKIAHILMSDKLPIEDEEKILADDMILHDIMKRYMRYQR
ncbi:19112_t:CDS:2 [Racocetra persica]|uniref:19112_t:CDS:1 n=1 Tax=Racocetra persica TaxID=160502 RepID=A0ACA9KWV4_9GLOM|nr:19112_t:CDS:2 [Racocetra persica]